MKGRLALFALLIVVLAGATPAHAGPIPTRLGQMTLEAQPLVNASSVGICDIFYVCSMWHEESPEWCTDWHVIYCGPAETFAASSMHTVNNEVEKKFVGRQLVLDNRAGSRKVRIDHVAPQYHLASGAIVEPSGTWNSRDANGETWNEVRSINQLSLNVANWEDKNKDGVVGVGDRVVFANGTVSTIKAVRLGVHVTVLSSTPHK
jgi:hypothetical protein